MVLFIGAFTGFGNTITDLSKNSEKVITVSADDYTVEVIALNMVTVDLFDKRAILFDNNSFDNKSSKTSDVYNSNYKNNNNIYRRSRDGLSC